MWSTTSSEAHAASGGLAIEGYERLKGLHGVTTREPRARIPIVDNDRDLPRLARVLDTTLAGPPGAHAVLRRRHGMYTWGETLAMPSVTWKY